MQEPQERELFARISRSTPGAWETFLDSYSRVLFRVAAGFAHDYDDRMDLFLFICSKLKSDGMRRLRAFRYRSEAPCRFSTYLFVVARNIALDHVRAKNGRFRPFRRILSLDEVDRLVFDYRFRDGRSVREVRGILENRHGLRLSDEEAGDRAGRVWSSLSSNQRWRMLARHLARQEPLAIDPVSGATVGGDGRATLPGGDGDPEEAFFQREAERILAEALAAIPPGQRLVLRLRFRDGLETGEVAEFLGVPRREAVRLAREGMNVLRERLRMAGIARPDLESAGLAGIWSN